MHFVTVPIVCPETGSKVLPHSSRCDRFYECSNGILHEVACIPGLYFNPEKGFCDFPEHFECKIEGGKSDESDSGEGGDLEDSGDKDEGSAKCVKL